MKNKNDVKNTMQVHSQAKVEFYKTYLKRYLRILYLSKYIKQINIYDVFCGMGIYEDGRKGSPIAAFDSIKEYLCDPHTTHNDTKITLIVNDKDNERILKVKNYIERENCTLFSVRYYNYDITQMFCLVDKEVNQDINNGRNLIFIDPYGYKDIKKGTIYDLMKNGKTEIIMFLPISHMFRFTKKAIEDKETAKYEPLRQFVYSFFSDNHIIRQEQINIMEYIKYISDALKYDGKFYTTSYYIERDNVNRFALFFITSHIFGFEKILEVKWQLDEESGRGFKIPDIQGNLFAEEYAEESKNRNAEKLEEILLNALSTPKNNKEVYEITLQNEFLPKHTTAIFTKWQKDMKNFKVREIKTGEIARKGAFYITAKEEKVNYIIQTDNEDN